ncbi:MAG: hypothetical protein E7110_09160 [Bacteroidales bacterium]|nr:hypothetical protein [Bacteroidales bacterium]
MLVEVNNRLAKMIEDCRNEERLNAQKAIICDILCEMIDDADINGTERLKFFTPMVVIADYVEILNEFNRVNN